MLLNFTDGLIVSSSNSCCIFLPDTDCIKEIPPKTVFRRLEIQQHFPLTLSYFKYFLIMPSLAETLCITLSGTSRGCRVQGKG